MYMLKYLFLIVIGILLYILLNRYNTFSIGVPTYYLIPYTKSMTTIDPEKVITEVVDIPNLGGVYDSTGGDTIIQYYPTNTIIQLDPIGGENPQDYWVTLLDPNNQEDRATILNDIRESQEREEREKNYKETEYYETDSEKRERENFFDRMVENDDNIFQDGDIILYENPGPIYEQLRINTNDGIIILPSNLPSYNSNPDRLYFVVRQITTGPLWRRTTAYRIVGFGGMNHPRSPAELGGRYIKYLMDFNRFVPITDFQIIFDPQTRMSRHDYDQQLNRLAYEFERENGTPLDITDTLRIILETITAVCAAISEGVPPKRTE